MPTSTLMNLENINKVVNEFIDDFNKNKITIDNKKSSIKAIKDLSKSLYNIGLFYEAYALNIKIYAQLENHIIQILSVLKNKI
jgi:archaellum component FlaC